MPGWARRAARLCRRAPAVGLREWRKHALRRSYLRGCLAGNVPPEPADAALVESGQDLRRALLAANEGRHAGSGYRVLMHRPGSITAEIWFGDLAQCLEYTGIACRVLPAAATRQELREAFESLRPNVFIAAESSATLTSLDLDFLHRYKREHGCLRLFVPVWHAQAPWFRGSRRDDEQRRDLQRRGLSADAHFSIFEPEFHERFSRDPRGPDIEYVAVPQACNPLNDYPRGMDKCHDWFMAASMTDERVEVCHRYLRPILARHRGDWAGPRWGFGATHVPPPDMPGRYARARIALSPLVDFVQRYGAEVTHRVFAAAACGAFQITMPTAITHRYFADGELVQAATPDQYARLFEHYWDRRDERNAIAKAALLRVLGQHTGFHRVEQLVAQWDRWRSRGLF
jgi:hypothetical protein